MKTSFNLYLLTLAFFLFNLALIQGQDCNAVPFMKKGAILEYAQYNKKGKVDSKVSHETITITENDNTTTATIKTIVKDNKNKEVLNTDYNANCTNGVYSIDMLRFFDLSKLAEQQKSNLDVEINGDVLEFPSEMKHGDELNDGNINIKLNSQGMTLVTMTFKVFNRKIESKESITTAAGTFDCQKVSFDFESKFGFITIKGKGVEWYHKDALLIKSESYNKKGKLVGSNELVSLK